jgi:hypothetical protein
MARLLKFGEQLLDRVSMMGIGPEPDGFCRIARRWPIEHEARSNAD